MLPAANVLKGLDDELDDLDDPITRANLDLLRAGQREQIQGFLDERCNGKDTSKLRFVVE